MLDTGPHDVADTWPPRPVQVRDPGLLEDELLASIKR
jgi:hypothetical protein